MNRISAAFTASALLLLTASPLLAQQVQLDLLAHKVLRVFKEQREIQEQLAHKVRREFHLRNGQ